MPSPPLLVTVPGVELAKTGSWSCSTGTWEPTAADFAEAVKALECPAVRRPVLKIGHTDTRFQPGDGEPTLGSIANLAVSADGNTLTGDFTGMPAWLAAQGDDGGSVLASAYPSRSVEAEYAHRCGLGHEHPFVLTGVALLGVTAPGVGTLGTLDDIAALYGVAAAADPKGRGVVIAHVTTPMRPPVAAAAGTTTHKDGGPGMPLELTEAQISLREKLGLPEDADGDAITKAAVEALTNPTPAATETATPPAPVLVEKPIPAGMTLVDEGTLSELKVAAAAGVAAKARQDHDDRVRTVAAAVADGRIPPARVTHWQDALQGDPEGMGTVLANMPKGLIPVGAPRGHDTQPEGAVAASAADDTAWVVPTGNRNARVEA